jgi:hypothetical protein
MRFYEGIFERFIFGNLGMSGGIPPPPYLSKGLTGAGFAKMVCKILSA